MRNDYEQVRPCCGMTEFYAEPGTTLNTVEDECAYTGGCATASQSSCGAPGGGGPGGGSPKYDEGLSGLLKDLFRPGADITSFIATLFDIFNYLF